jgi:phthalate 3,4-dioxygenase subunit beta
VVALVRLHDRQSLVSTSPMSMSPDERLGGGTVVMSVAPSTRVRATDPLYWELVEFLDDEAELLDENRVAEWLALLADDIRYWAPVRVTRGRDEGSEFAASVGHFDDTYGMLQMRVAKLTSTKSAWAEDPPSRTRRFVTNVKVFETDVADEYLARNNLLLVRNRWDLPDWELISARRDDVLRRTADGWRIARRTIFIDQSTLAVANLAIFL